MLIDVLGAKELRHLRSKCALAFFCCAVLISAKAAVIPGQFTDIGAGLPGVNSGVGLWGDFDSDGDLDVFLTGTTNGFASGYFAGVYRNDAGTFQDISASFAPARYDAAAWGDYDNDGDLDLAIAGFDPAGQSVIVGIYQNNGGYFTQVQVGLPAGVGGQLAWADLDNNGERDLVVTISPEGQPRVHWNNGGTFNEYTRLPLGVGHGDVVCGDYDNDGNLDLLMAGFATGEQVCRVLRNTGNRTFQYMNFGLQGVSGAAIAWGDYNRDGRLDILLAGDTVISNRNATVCRIYRNEGTNVFTDIQAGLPDMNSCSASWGDYDNDGLLDILMSGGGPGLEGRLTRVYRNNHGSFTDYVDVQGAWFGSVAWGDYDNDGRLDFLLTGYAYTPVYSRISRIYRNLDAVTNRPPSAPANLNAWSVGTNVLLTWDAATDDETPAEGLSYNFASQTPSPETGILPLEASPDGHRFFPAAGTSHARCFAWLRGLTNGQQISWSVQAVDSALAGGPLATEHSFTHPPPKWPGPGASILKSSGAVQVLVTNSPPFDWRMYASTNFQSWTSTGVTGVWDGKVIRFREPMDSNSIRQFYQLRMP